jgi:hypothetical protein
LHGLGQIREAAAKDKKLCFTYLIHHFTTDLLLESYYALNCNAAPEVDEAGKNKEHKFLYTLI